MYPTANVIPKAPRHPIIIRSHVVLSEVLPADIYSKAQTITSKYKLNVKNKISKLYGT